MLMVMFLCTDLFFVYLNWNAPPCLIIVGGDNLAIFEIFALHYLVTLNYDPTIL